MELGFKNVFFAHSLTSKIDVLIRKATMTSVVKQEKRRMLKRAAVNANAILWGN